MTLYGKRKIAGQLTKSDTAKTADKKGDILEKLAIYIFEAIPGVSFLANNILDCDRSKEIDVVFLNDFRVSDLFFLKEGYLVVECKNHKTPIGSQDVATFITKLRENHFSTGILISLSGITGSPSKITSAYSVIYRSFIADGISVILLDRNDLLSLNKVSDFVKLILKRHKTLVFQKSFS